MTDTEIIKAVAELDGWKFGEGRMAAFCQPPPYEFGVVTHDKLPSYLTSLDAIVPVIEKQDEWAQRHFIEALQDTTEEISVIKLFLATPRQLCEALLRATGKWKE